MMKKRGQIWVETIIYTLIAFAMIGLVLMFVKPKIEEVRDHGIIEQSINILQEINSVILTMGDPGNQREVKLGISKGSLTIDGINNLIYFELDSKSIYSQPGEEVNIGGVFAVTEERGEVNNIVLTTKYNDTHNITYNGKEEIRSLSRASTPYKLLLMNKGWDSLNRTIIEVRVN